MNPQWYEKRYEEGPMILHNDGRMMTVEEANRLEALAALAQEMADYLENIHSTGNEFDLLDRYHALTDALDATRSEHLHS